MTQGQINVFNKLLADESFKGKKELRHLLWLNTSKPKFKVGDCFIVSDPSHKVFGYRVKNFKAKVIEITSWRNQEDWYYHLEMSVECDGMAAKFMLYQFEHDLIKAKRCKDNKNILGTAKDDCIESLEI